VSPSPKASGSVQEGRTRETETEEGRVKVDDDRLEVEDGSGVLEVNDVMLRARGRWVVCLRSTVAHSEPGMRRQRAPRLGSRQWRALRSGMRQRRGPGPGLRMEGGISTVVSWATEEREHLAVSKNC
jgi:hypothetical protein